MNDTEHISLREFLMLISLGLMPPLLKLVPAAPAVTAGRAGWLAPIMAAAPVLVGICLVVWLGKGLPEDAGLGEGLCIWLGRPLGRILCGVYGVAFLLLTAIALRFCAERFTSTIYPETKIGLFFGVILGLEWYLGRRKLAVTARAGQLFFYVMVVTLVVVLLLGLGSMKRWNVSPMWVDDLPAVIQTTPPIVGGVSIGVGWMFLFGKVREREKGLRRGLRWGLLLLMMLTALGLVVMGVFGQELVVRLQIPFFSLAKEIQIGSAVQRVEPLVVTMWVFADVISMALLLRSGEKAFCCALGREMKLNVVMLAAVVPLAYLCADSFFRLDTLYQRVFVPMELVLFVVVPMAAGVVGKLRNGG